MKSILTTPFRPITRSKTSHRSSQGGYRTVNPDQFRLAKNPERRNSRPAPQKMGPGPSRSGPKS